MLCVMESMPAFGDLKSEISNLKSLEATILPLLRSYAERRTRPPHGGSAFRSRTPGGIRRPRVDTLPTRRHNREPGDNLDDRAASRHTR